MVGVSYSKYTSEGSDLQNAKVSVFDTQLVIYNGDDASLVGKAECHFYATAKLSEPNTMIEGACDCVSVDITNRSECDVRVSDLNIAEIRTVNGQSAYSKLVLNESTDYIDNHNGIAGAANAYMQKALSDYYQNLDDIQDEKEKAEIQMLQTTFASDDDFFYPIGSDNPIRYDRTLLSDVDYLNQLIRVTNKITIARMNNPAKGFGTVIPVNEKKTFLILLWVEHDNVYKADADANNAAYSEKTPTQLLGNNDRSKVTESFYVIAHSEQID